MFDEQKPYTLQKIMTANYIWDDLDNRSAKTSLRDKQTKT